MHHPGGGLHPLYLYLSTGTLQDCDAAVAVIGDGLGNLVEILQDAGIIGGTTT